MMTRFGKGATTSRNCLVVTPLDESEKKGDASQLARSCPTWKITFRGTVRNMLDEFGGITPSFPLPIETPKLFSGRP